MVPGCRGPCARHNPDLAGLDRPGADALCDQGPFDSRCDGGHAGPLLSLAWDVALLGAPGLLHTHDEAALVRRPAVRVLVRELSVLLPPVSSASETGGDRREVKVCLNDC